MSVLSRQVDCSASYKPVNVCIEVPTRLFRYKWRNIGRGNSVVIHFVLIHQFSTRIYIQIAIGTLVE